MANVTTSTMVNARQERERHENDIRLFRDTTKRDVMKRLPKYAEPLTARAQDEVWAPLEAYLRKVESIRTSGRYTQEGERAELRMAAQAMLEKLAAFRDATVKPLDAQLAEKRAAALQRKKPTDPAEALVRELRQRELRDHLRTLDPLQVQARIRQAVNAGASTDFLEAIENAPAGFPVAPAQLVEETRAAIAERDHPELGELAQLRGAYEYIVGTAAQLLKASGDFSPEDQTLVDDSKKSYLLSGEAIPEAAR